MRFFGKGSLSSFMSGLLRAAWYLAWAAALLGLIAGLAIVFHAQLGYPFSEGLKDSSSADQRDWEWFQSLPLAIRICILPYFGGILGLFIAIIGRSRRLFRNFTDELVFDHGNVRLIGTISRMLIAFSILTLSPGSFLAAVILLLLCEVIKNGTALQEEHDLTI